MYRSSIIRFYWFLLTFLVVISTAVGNADSSTVQIHSLAAPTPGLYLPLVVHDYAYQHRQGDWIVTGGEVVENVEILLDGNLIVEAGGSLTLRNVRLTLNGTYNGQYGIRVKSGGALTVEGSAIQAARDDGRFSFVVEVGNPFVMRNSELHECGWGIPYQFNFLGEDSGLTIYSNDPIIENSIFSNNFAAIRLMKGGSGGMIKDNRMSANAWSGIDMAHWSEVTITDNIFSDSPNGLWLGDSNRNLFLRNSFSRHSEAVIMSESWDNEFSENIFGEKAGIFIMKGSGNIRVLNNIFTKENAGIASFQSTNNLIQGNTIVDSTIARDWGILLSYTNDTIVANNVLTDIGHEFGAVQLYHSSQNKVINNQITNLTSPASGDWPGILVWGSSQDNTIQANTVSGAFRGIELHYSANGNTITYNDVASSSAQSVLVESSTGNFIHHNNFIDGGDKPYDDSGTNQWDDGAEGNYWSDYDGSGTKPYVIPPSGTDHHPLLNPVTVSPAPVPPFIPIPKPPLMDDSEIIIDKPTTIENQTYKLNHPLWIVEGGSLTLNNVTMLLGDIVPYILVQPGGALYVHHTTIAPEQIEYGGWNFFVMPDSTLVIQDSEIRGIGFWPDSADLGVLYIYSSDVLLQNTKITDSIGVQFWAATAGGRLIGNVFSECGSCLQVLGGSGVHVEGNTINHSLWRGLWIEENAEGGTFLNNTVTNASGTGILFHIDNTTIRGNVISNSLGNGWIAVNSNNNLFENNRLEGIQRRTWDFQGGSGNIITGNTITNSYSALSLNDTTRNNKIYHNNFGPTVQPSTDEGSGNQWDNGSEGNFWVDYTGVDADGDGIGDTPYYILPNGVDHYPLMEPYGGVSFLTQRKDKVWGLRHLFLD